MKFTSLRCVSRSDILLQVLNGDLLGLESSRNLARLRVLDRVAQRENPLARRRSPSVGLYCFFQHLLHERRVVVLHVERIRERPRRASARASCYLGQVVVHATPAAVEPHKVSSQVSVVPVNVPSCFLKMYASACRHGRRLWYVHHGLDELSLGTRHQVGPSRRLERRFPSNAFLCELCLLQQERAFEAVCLPSLDLRQGNVVQLNGLVRVHCVVHLL